MAEIVKFPLDRVDYDVESYRAEPAMLLILPVIRIERDPDGPFIRPRTRRGKALEATMWDDDGLLIPIR